MSDTITKPENVTASADANTNPVARLWPEKAADAMHIVKAVNERPNLRYLVQRLADTLGIITDLLKRDYEIRHGITSESITSFHGVEFADVLREAREALGEDAR